MGADFGYPIDNRPTGKLSLSFDQLNLISGINTLVSLNAVMPNFNDSIENTIDHWIKPNKPGFYLVIGQVTFGSVVADKDYQVRIIHRKDVGSTTPYAQDIKHSSNAEDLTCQVVDLIWLYNDQPIDAFELWVTQNSGVNTVDILSGSPYTFLIVQRLR